VRVHLVGLGLVMIGLVTGGCAFWEMAGHSWGKLPLRARERWLGAKPGHKARRGYRGSFPGGGCRIDAGLREGAGLLGLPSLHRRPGVVEWSCPTISGLSPLSGCEWV